MGNPVVHFELWSKDPAKVSAFYETVFDWKMNFMPQMDYRIVDTQATGEMKGINGGIMKPQEGPWPGNMAFYIMVDDLKTYKQKILDAGGKMLVEEQEVGGMGWFSLFSDPDGRVMGIWKIAG
jgi:uncharacterized protein